MRIILFRFVLILALPLVVIEAAARELRRTWRNMGVRRSIRLHFRKWLGEWRYAGE